MKELGTTDGTCRSQGAKGSDTRIDRESQDSQLRIGLSRVSEMDVCILRADHVIFGKQNHVSVRLLVGVWGWAKRDFF